jgi:hypothetical protein
MVSSLHRALGTHHAHEESVRGVELAMLREAREWSLGFGDAEYLDDLEVLADLQHYGLPTRLIDVTSNPMTALWFACQKPPQPDVSQSGVLLAINVSNWEGYTSVGVRTAPSPGEIANEVTLAHALERREPFVVRAAHPNNRLRAQEGYFITSATPSDQTSNSPFLSLRLAYSMGDQDALTKALATERDPGRPRHLPFVAIHVRAGVKSRLLKYLEGTYNRSARTLFPDYSGMHDHGSFGARWKFGGPTPAILELVSRTDPEP